MRHQVGVPHHAERRRKRNHAGIRVTRGRGAPVMLLIMGLGMQLVSWPDPFCQLLVQRGFRVVRFDNRDCGLSQKMDHLGKPHLVRSMIRASLGLPVRAPYSLDDMARDTVGLLEALGIRSAHVVGASMGGMIAQLVAASYPERVRTLTSIMSTTGARLLPQPKAHVRRQLLRRPANPADVESVTEHLVRMFTLIGSPAYPTPPEEMRLRIRRSVERGYHPAGRGPPAGCDRRGRRSQPATAQHLLPGPGHSRSRRSSGALRLRRRHRGQDSEQPARADRWFRPRFPGATVRAAGRGHRRSRVQPLSELACADWSWQRRW